MADDNIEQKIKEAEKEQQEKALSNEQTENKLEQDINNSESKGIIAKAFGAVSNIVSTAAVAGTTIALTGTSAAVVAASFAAGYVVDKFRFKDKKKKGTLLDEVKIGSLMGAMSHYFYRGVFDFIPNADLVGKLIKGGIVALGYLPFYNAVHLPVRHIIENYNPYTFIKNLFSRGPAALAKETYQQGIKPNYKDVTKNHVKYFGLPVGINVNYTIPELQIPVVAGLVFGYRLLFGGIEYKKQQAKQKQIPQMDDYRKKQQAMRQREAA